MTNYEANKLVNIKSQNNMWINLGKIKYLIFMGVDNSDIPKVEYY